ncbi:MAG: aldo/keto reductase [Gammaproteobacteria bacterium]|jgi:aryl-alcohol dehydrogenase-like predicted oxidoreductase
MPISRRAALKAGVGSVAALVTPGLAAQSQAVNFRTIPKTGESIPPVGIGTNRYGVGNDESARAPLRDTLARFAELGGKVIDTAFRYGTAEAVLGDLIGELGIRDQLFLVSKTDIRGRVRGVEGFNGSLQRLATDVLDAMLVHNFANTNSELAMLREMKAQGRVRYIGASTSEVRQHDQMVQLLRSEELDIIQINYSLGDRASAETILPLAADRGVAVMINIPFSGARNSLFNVVEGHDLPEWAAEFDCASWGQFFLKYIISHPAVTVVIPGTRQVRHVNDNFGAAMGRLPDAGQRRRQEEFFDSIT